MDLVIDRITWLRGDDGQSMLYRRHDSKMCCMGSYGVACGLTTEQMAGHFYLSGGSTRIACDSRLFEHPAEENRAQSLQRQLAAANDDAKLSGPEREERITDLFAMMDVAVTFVN